MSLFLTSQFYSIIFILCQDHRVVITILIIEVEKCESSHFVLFSYDCFYSFVSQDLYGFQDKLLNLCTKKAIENSEKVCKCKGYKIEIELDYNNLENFKYYCSKKNIQITKIEYLDVIVCKIELEKKTKQNK